MKIPKIFTEAGWFSGQWGAAFSLGGLLVAILPWFFDINVGYSLVLTCIGSVISLLGSYEGKAKQFGYQAPFTSDPLGWRKAKQSYKQDEVQKSQDDESATS